MVIKIHVVGEMEWLSASRAAWKQLLLCVSRTDSCASFSACLYSPPAAFMFIMGLPWWPGRIQQGQVGPDSQSAFSCWAHGGRLRKEKMKMTAMACQGVKAGSED